jgi:hypothetical protein
MVITKVSFPAPQPGPDKDSMQKNYARLFPIYQSAKGLRRKYFARQGKTGVGIYEWLDRESAESFFDEDRRQWMSEALSPDFTIEFLEVAAIVDNEAGRAEFLL